MQICAMMFVNLLPNSIYIQLRKKGKFMNHNMNDFLFNDEKIILTDHPQSEIPQKSIRHRLFITFSIWIIGFLIMMIFTNQYGTYLFLTIPCITTFTLASILELLYKFQRAKHLVYIITDSRVIIKNEKLKSFESFRIDQIFKIDKISDSLDLWIESNKKVRLSNLSKVNEFYKRLKKKEL